MGCQRRVAAGLGEAAARAFAEKRRADFEGSKHEASPLTRKKRLSFKTPFRQAQLLAVYRLQIAEAESKWRKAKALTTEAEALRVYEEERLTELEAKVQETEAKIADTVERILVSFFSLAGKATQREGIHSMLKLDEFLILPFRRLNPLFASQCLHSNEDLLGRARKLCAKPLAPPLPETTLSEKTWLSATSPSASARQEILACRP